eukprot:756092-Hanusia_phi.AAC.6
MVTHTKFYFEGTERCRPLDYILFKRWVPCSISRYTWSCLAIILMGMIDILLKVAKVTNMSSCWCCNKFQLRLEMSFAISESSKNESAEESSSSELLEMTALRQTVREIESVHLLPQSSCELRQNVCRGALAAITLALDYSLMFIAMTFNIGLFSSVCLGIGLGHVLFGHHFKLSKVRSLLLRAAPDAQAGLEQDIATSMLLVRKFAPSNLQAHKPAHGKLTQGCNLRY